MVHRPQDQPSKVTAEGGEVLVDGPDGLALSFTPDAAEATAGRLNDGAKAARAQLSMKVDKPR